MADVFISYAREDRLSAEQIARGLSGLGLEAFWDTEIPPGQTWADYIEGKLAACKAVIVLWSANSTKSQWVREEARMGRDRGRLIPVMLDASSPPLGFGEVQAADLSAWRGELSDPSWKRLANAVYGAARDGAAPPLPQSGWSAPPPVQSGWTAQARQPHQQAQSFAQAPSGDVEHLSPVGYILKCLRLYANGKDRARRTEYWWWAIFLIVALFVAAIIDVGMSGVNPYTNSPNSQILTTLTYLGLLAPGISVSSRRFHDLGWSGWLASALFAAQLLGAVMVQSAMPAGALLVLAVLIVGVVAAFMPSKPGPNQYGPNPKGL